MPPTAGNSKINLEENGNQSRQATGNASSNLLDLTEQVQIGVVDREVDQDCSRTTIDPETRSSRDKCGSTARETLYSSLVLQILHVCQQLGGRC